MKESDWKTFRQLSEVALARFCQRVLDEVGQVTADASRSPHERYLAIYRLIHDRDDELADAFNDPRRSQADLQLALIQFHGLLTEEEMGRFSDETRESVELLLQLRRK
jgi:hypothetical protein